MFFANVRAVVRLRPYFGRKCVTISTNIDSQKWILKLSDTFGRLTRLHLRLSNFDFDVAHRAGVSH